MDSNLFNIQKKIFRENARKNFFPWKHTKNFFSWKHTENVSSIFFFTWKTILLLECVIWPFGKLSDFISHHEEEHETHTCSKNFPRLTILNTYHTVLLNQQKCAIWWAKYFLIGEYFISQHQFSLHDFATFRTLSTSIYQHNIGSPQFLWKM